eukprot:CAMPEP_0174305786 /NCGR_PEP_ID=MMETSP0810-20121108/36_1 /TAXON_ID=73025 ORGANISM="Eutreptiella gymnastica-like, Strain CCMP1594" /NCGR_SAMPLE_ID=MMETSP0810 /ASSEMBLY_ACC=CAM_ASM_000659 /LENGTH=522 /DNA_ID=CAMNT_0015412323 /DNA_START=90 /DNA_END=1658 /DNA_ORIENTATION=-
MPEDAEKEPEPKENELKEKERVFLQLPAGTIVKNRWKLTAKIGQGAFGETYGGYDLNSPDGQQVAVKVERWDNKKMVLKLEVMAMKKLQPCPFVVKYVSSGRQDDFNFLVMERLGENLAELRKKTTAGYFSMGTTLRLGIQMLEAIEGCHNLAYIHRDIKPSNFVIGKTEQKRRRCFLIDFGLARKYRMPGGEIRQPRKSAGFRGTARYASVHSHQSKELCRRDDLWSLFYVLVEFASGSLPWRKVKDKDQIGELKEKHTNMDLVKDLPKSFGLFMEHLQSLEYKSTPDYMYLRSLLQSVLDQEGVTAETPYDWETVGTTSSSRNGSFNKDEHAQPAPAAEKPQSAEKPTAAAAAAAAPNGIAEHTTPRSKGACRSPAEQQQEEQKASPAERKSENNTPDVKGKESEKDEAAGKCEDELQRTKTDPDAEDGRHSSTKDAAECSPMEHENPQGPSPKAAEISVQQTAGQKQPSSSEVKEIKEGEASPENAGSDGAQGKNVKAKNPKDNKDNKPDKTSNYTSAL